MAVTIKTVIAAIMALVLTSTLAHKDDEPRTYGEDDKPEYFKCEKDDETGDVTCPDGLECAHGGGGWMQCVNCTEPQFTHDCPYWHDEDLLENAEEVCGTKCLGQRGNQCNTIECDEDAGIKCARSSDTWAQCIDCAEEAFQEDCGYWSDALAAAAEEKCETTCHARLRLL